MYLLKEVVHTLPDNTVWLQTLRQYSIITIVTRTLDEHLRVWGDTQVMASSTALSFCFLLLSPPLHSSPHPLLIAQEWWRIYWGHSYLLPFSGKIYWRESSILFWIFVSNAPDSFSPSHWTFPTHALNLPYACMHWTFPTHACIEPSLRMYALNLPYACMHLALFPGAQEGEEKECLVHTVCACA